MPERTAISRFTVLFLHQFFPFGPVGFHLSRLDVLDGRVILEVFSQVFCGEPVPLGLMIFIIKVIFNCRQHGISRTGSKPDISGGRAQPLFVKVLTTTSRAFGSR